MQVANIMKMSIAVMIAALLMVSIVAPLVDSASKETTTITNEGAGDLRYTYAAEPIDYSSTIVYNDVSDEISAGFGSGDLQTIAATESIIWASNIGSIIFNGATFYLMIDDGEHVVNVDLGDGCDISVADGVVSIADANDTVYSGAITWSYAPQKNGQFGFFTDSGATVKDFPAATAGTFAGAYAYNSINSLGLSTLAPTYSITDGVFTTGPWTVPDLGAKTVKTLPIVEEKEIKEIEEKEIAVKAATPAYTDGDWGYNLENGNAVIVSYSGAAGNISIPSTVGGYTVTTLGDAINAIFDSAAITGSTLTIPDTVVTINNKICSGCSGFTGSLVIPDSVTYIGRSAFFNCSGFDSLTLSSNVTEYNQMAFYGCSGFTGSLVIPDSVTSIGQSSFSNCSGFTGSLVIPDSVTSIGQECFSSCSGFTGSLVIPDSVTSISTRAFQYCTGFNGTLILAGSINSVSQDAFLSTRFTSMVVCGDITSIGSNAFKITTLTELLNLGNTAITAGNYGIPETVTVDDEIPSLGYMAPATFSETVQKTGTLYTIMGMLPVLMLAGVLVMTAAAFINNRRA